MLCQVAIPSSGNLRPKVADCDIVLGEVLAKLVNTTTYYFVLERYIDANIESVDDLTKN